MRADRVWMWCVPVLATLLLGALVVEAQAQERNRLAELGEHFYFVYCASCHGLGGKGDGPVAPTLKEVPPDLTLIAARREGVFPEHEIREIIDGRKPLGAHGRRDMPVWGRQFGRILPDGQYEPVVRGPIILMVRFLDSIQVTE